MPNSMPDAPAPAVSVVAAMPGSYGAIRSPSSVTGSRLGLAAVAVVLRDHPLQPRDAVPLAPDPVGQRGVVAEFGVSHGRRAAGVPALDVPHLVLVLAQPLVMRRQLPGEQAGRLGWLDRPGGVR